MLLQIVFPFYIIIPIGKYLLIQILYIYDFRFGDTDNGEANDTITAKANDVLFNFTGYGSYLVLVIKE